MGENRIVELTELIVTILFVTERFMQAKKRIQVGADGIAAAELDRKMGTGEIVANPASDV